MKLLDDLSALERALARAGFPAMSPWWRSTLERFYASGRRQLVLRVGRRGGKSSTLCRVAVVEALYGEHVVPPGDVGVVAIVSVSRDEATQRLRTIRAILDALHVGYRPIEHGIELTGRPVAFKTFVASISGVSGFTAIAAICDEVAKWRDADTGANPASEVLASLRPTMATQPHAKLFLSSSPFGKLDAHAAAFGAGETPYQCVAYAPTWQANPTITEQRTHELEPDTRKWSREYLARPQADSLCAFDQPSIDRAIGYEVPPDWQVDAPVALIDPSAGSSDSWAFAIARWTHSPDGDRHALELLDVSGVADARAKGIASNRIVDAVCIRARERGVEHVHSDQFERYSLESAFRSRGFAFTSHTWTSALKERAVEHVRAWLRDGLLFLPNHEKLRTELLMFDEHVAPSGALTFAGRRGGHDDFSMLVLLAALVDIEGGFPGSPSGGGDSGYSALMGFYELQCRRDGIVAPGRSYLPPAPPEPPAMGMVAPAHLRCTTLQVPIGQAYIVGPDGHVLVRPADIPMLRARGFVAEGEPLLNIINP